MTDTQWTLIGRPESGYTLKVRAAMRFKGVDFQWLDRFQHRKLFQQHARVQLIPLVLRPDGSAMQDSTPILEYLETEYPEPSLHPTDPALRFVSDLLEEYGDEWGNKLMFHYRWGYPADQKVRSRSLAQGTLAAALPGFVANALTPLVAPLLVRRMVPRLAFAGANPNNAPIIEDSWATVVEVLQQHLQTRPYLFGGRPAFADFGLWGQLHQAWTDPTCHAHLEANATAVVDWIKRMDHPAVEGEFETLEQLKPTLTPLFEREVGPRFLAWAVANKRALEAGETHTELPMAGQTYSQKTFKYPAQGIDLIADKLRGLGENPALSVFLEETGCLPHLRAI